KDSLRRHIARQFYLLSNLFSLTQARFIAAVEGNPMQKTLNNRASLKCFEVQGHCKQCLSDACWEPNLQYRFPKQIYIELLSSMQTYSPKRSHAEFMTCMLFKTTRFRGLRDHG